MTAKPLGTLTPLGVKLAVHLAQRRVLAADERDIVNADLLEPANVWTGCAFVNHRSCSLIDLRSKRHSRPVPWGIQESRPLISPILTLVKRSGVGWTARGDRSKRRKVEFQDVLMEIDARSKCVRSFSGRSFSARMSLRISVRVPWKACCFFVPSVARYSTSAVSDARRDESASGHQMIPTQGCHWLPRTPQTFAQLLVRTNRKTRGHSRSMADSLAHRDFTGLWLAAPHKTHHHSWPAPPPGLISCSGEWSLCSP